MNFRIEFLLNNNTVVEIRQVMNEGGKLRDQLNDLYCLSCKLVLESDGSHWEIEDELPVLVSRFCLNSMVELKERGRSSYPYFELNGELKLELKGSNVLIYGDFVEALSVDHEALKTCFENIGHMSIAFLQMLHTSKYDPDLEMIRQALDNFKYHIRS